MVVRNRSAASRFTVLYVTLLSVFILWILLDTFVIAHRMATVETMDETGTGIEATQEVVITEDSWTGPGIRVRLSQTRYLDTTIHLADIELSDTGKLRTALAENTFGRNIRETVAEMAEAHDAILAINGDYYGSRRSGYVIRNGVLYRSVSAGRDQEDLCIWLDGNMTIVREGEMEAKALQDAGARQVFSFGPALIEDGEIAVSTGQEVGRAMASNPRTAIAMFTPLHYLFVVSDGRTVDERGLSLQELASFLMTQEVSLAYNLDGGGSSTMVFLGNVLNWPTTNGRRSERQVSDIVYIAQTE